ncbi:ATP-binding protein [Streptomyces sp. MMBL 11-3]|uniref:ATP-binding protein n=1 Tax=Streptomyces sp. MMBL 11-3 TaxID=3382639 RepID=UPI0039B38D64
MTTSRRSSSALPAPARPCTSLPDPPANCPPFHFDNSQQITALRQFTARRALAAALPAHRIDSLLVCVDEAAANAVRHGGGKGSCRIWTSTGAILCDITSPQGTLNTALAGYLPPAASLMDGRGLWIIRQLSDAADIRSTRHGTIIRIRIDPHPPRPSHL